MVVMTPRNNLFLTIKITHLVFIITFFLMSCHSRNEMLDKDFNSKIDSLYTNCVIKDSCIMSFDKLIPVKWDRMFIVGDNNNSGASNQNLIGKLIEAKYSGRKKDVLGRSIIFTLNGKFIYEIYSSFYDLDSDSQQYYISFSGDGKQLPKFFSCKGALFRVEKVYNGFNLVYLNR